MKKNVIGIVFALAVAGVGFAALGGVEWMGSVGLLGAERELENRVVGYWEARVDNDVDDMAKFVHPDSSVADPGLMRTLGYELISIEIEGDRATAHVSTRTRLQHPMLSARVRDRELRQGWVRHADRWVVADTPSPMEALSSLTRPKIVGQDGAELEPAR